MTTIDYDDMEPIIPDIAWYTDISKSQGLAPRCPFASVYRCPRYYQSLSLMGHAGCTSIDPKTDENLLKRWKESDLWPVTREQETMISGPTGNKTFTKFCPEVSFECFGLFASFMARYADRIDSGIAERKLAKEKASSRDWRWAWEYVTPMHYSECPYYSPLANRQAASKEKGTPMGDIVEIKPGFLGISLNVRALVRRFLQWARL